MVQVQILPVERPSAILARIAIPLENVVPGKFDLFLRQPVEQGQHDDARNPDPETDGMDTLGIWPLIGEIPPL
jgi:hypothetical protein